MNLRNRPELQDRLAAEYALGTLRGAARARFQRWMADDAATARAAAEWASRLAPLALAVAPVPPPARVWRAIEARLGTTRAGLWESLGFWRALGLGASGMAAALLAALGLIAPEAPPPAPAPVVLRAPANEIPASYLAVLADPKTQKPMLVVSAGRKDEQLWVKALDPSIHVAGKSLELWALPASGAPRSLGLVGAAEKTMLKLAAVADVALAEVPALAVSLEPSGGSPTGQPTGPVLFSGPCVKYW